ncbi:MAG: capsule assembly Wzi family protein, partial [Candidatus Binatia bacterium]
FKPLRGLELGLSRSAQWCGEGRPCDLSTFRKLLFGNDNRGVNLSRAQEPGNQLAGYDFRWASPLIDLPFAVYGQTIGEDEAGGLPSKFLGQFGVETWGGWKGTSYRIHLEYSDTACGFASSTPQLNCAYNHGIYRSGYRYRGRSIGFATDNAARLVAAGVTRIDAWSHPWNLLLRRVRLNRDGGGQNNLTLAAQTINNLELSNSLKLGGARFTWGVGVDRRRDESGNGLSYDERGFFQWEQRLQ